MKTERLLRKASQVLASTVTGAALTASMLALPAVSQAQYAVSDSQLQSNVAAAIHNDSKLASDGIQATVSEGVVTLSGDVADESVRNEAEQVAAGVSGVKSIQDNLNVGEPPTATADEGTPPPPEQGSPTTAMPPPPPSQEQGNPAAGMPPPPEQGNPTTAMPPPPPASPGTAASGMPPAPPDEQSGNQGYTPYPNEGAPPPPAQGQYAPGQYGGENGGWGPRGQARVPGSAPLLAVSPQQQNASGPVTLPAGTLVSVRTTQPLSTANLKGGEYFQVTAANNIYQNGVVAIPRGAVLNGQVVEAKNAGAFGGSPRLDLRLTSIQLGPTTYPLVSDDWDSRGPSKTGYTAANTAGGAVFGALIGAIAGGGVGAGVGAIAGGATGAAVSGATHGPRLTLPPETLLQFHVKQPLTVQPLKYSEAERVAASTPTLIRRPYPPPPYPYGVRAYPYGYPYPPAY